MNIQIKKSKTKPKPDSQLDPPQTHLIKPIGNIVDIPEEEKKEGIDGNQNQAPDEKPQPLKAKKKGGLKFTSKLDAKKTTTTTIVKEASPVQKAA